MLSSSRETFLAAPRSKGALNRKRESCHDSQRSAIIGRFKRPDMPQPIGEVGSARMIKPESNQIVTPGRLWLQHFVFQASPAPPSTTSALQEAKPEDYADDIGHTGRRDLACEPCKNEKAKDTSSGATDDYVRLRVTNRRPLIEPVAEITLRGTLNHAIELLAACFEDCNRRAEPGSICAQHAEACRTNYRMIDGHRTTETFTTNFAKSLMHSGLDYLKGAINAVLDTGSDVRWSSLALTRSLIEASTQCHWLVDPAIDLDTRLRRTNQMFARACDEALQILPDESDSASRLLQVDPRAYGAALNRRDAALHWAQSQGWRCSNGEEISRSRWIGEIPSKKTLVALAAEGEAEYWRDVYGMLSGATHSTPALMLLALRDEPQAFLDRALLVLDIGVLFYTRAFKSYADFMGWNNHELDKWFAPVHATLQHIRFSEDAPLPVERISPDQCSICPDYESPGMHRLALTSHLLALLERNVGNREPAGDGAPDRYAKAVSFLTELHAQVESENQGDADGGVHQLRAVHGSGHIGALSLLGFDPSEAISSIAATWAVIGSPDYQSTSGNVQGWLWQAEGHRRPRPYGNE